MAPRSCPRASVSSRSEVHSEEDSSARDWNQGAPQLHISTGPTASFHDHHQSRLRTPTANSGIPVNPSSMYHRRSRTPPSLAGSRRRYARNTAFQTKLAQMRIRLSPIVQISTGAVHPAFPKTLLNFWLLTEEQLDSLATFYHQRYPNEFTMAYPCPVEWPAAGLTIADKRRKMGRFIGLRGCDSPVVIKTEDEIREEVRRNAAMEEEMRLRGKLGRGFPG